MSDDALAFAYKHCEELVRDVDEDRFLKRAVSPADKRPHLIALYAFSHEIARVRDSVREAMIGEIRLQWWRDTLQGEARGDVRANPIAAALDDTIVKFRLPRQALVDLIDARVFDLYDDPMPSLNDLEGYCGETSSSLFRFASIILCDGTDPAMPMLPVTRVSLPNYRTSPRLSVAFPTRPELCSGGDPRAARRRSRGHRDRAGRSGPHGRACGHARGCPLASRADAGPARTIVREGAACLSVAGARQPYLGAWSGADYDPFNTPVDMAKWRKIWFLWRGWSLTASQSGVSNATRQLAPAMHNRAALSRRDALFPTRLPC